MQKGKILELLTEDFITKSGLEFRSEGYCSLYFPNMDSINYYSVNFKITNESDDESEKLLSCEIKVYNEENEEGYGGVYVDICIYKKPACRIIISTDRICESVDKIKDYRNTIKNAIEYGRNVVNSKNK